VVDNKKLEKSHLSAVALLVVKKNPKKKKQKG